MTGMVADLEPDVARMKEIFAGDGYATATDLADWLTRTLKMPFRDAHHVTAGRIVAAAAAAGLPLDKLPLETMQAVEPKNHWQDHQGGLCRAVGRRRNR